MKSFVWRCLLFVLLLLVASIGVFEVMEAIADKKRSEFLQDSDVFVWGDSDIYRGLLLDDYASATGKVCKSSAYEGAGSYDFLVFAEEVPDGSTCIISFADEFLLKAPNLDNNRSGLATWPILKLVKLGWSPKELFKTAKGNRFHPKMNFEVVHTPCEESDTMIAYGSMDNWQIFYNNDDEYVCKKFEAYKVAVQRLVDKSCSLVFLRLPIGKELEDTICNSYNRQRENQLIEEMVEKYNIVEDSVCLEGGDLLLHDCFHLNNKGAAMATQFMIELDLLDGRNHFVTIVL